MFIFKISKNRIKIALVVVILLTVGFSIYSYRENIKFRNRYESIICIANECNDSNLISFVSQVKNKPKEHKNIEVFDIGKEEVIQKMQSSVEIQKEVEGYLKDITDVYIRVKAFPNKGYIIKVPLEPSAKIKNKWLNDYNINSVDEVFILLPDKGMPYLMVLDGKERPIFYNFKSSTDSLLEKLELSSDKVDKEAKININIEGKEQENKENPIDKAFQKDFEIALYTPELNYLGEKYLEAWKAEWDNITETLKERYQFKEDKDRVDNYKKSYEEFVKRASELEWIKWSDTSVEPGKGRTFGTGAISAVLLGEARLYRDQVFYLLNGYFDLSKYKYSFIYKGNGAEIEKLR